MLIPFGILGASGGGAAGAFELISTTLLSSDTATVTFSTIPQTYKHLQVRYVASYRDAYTDIYAAPLRFNNDSGTNYSSHRLSGASTNGYGLTVGVSSVGSANQSWIIPNFIGDSQKVNYFGVGIIDILDYSSTVKNKTTRTLSGSAPYGVILSSGSWMSTAAVTSLSLYGPFIPGSRFSLYGIKG